MVANVQKDLCSSLVLKSREFFSLMHTSRLKSHIINDKFVRNKCLFQKNNLSSLIHSFTKKVSKPITNIKPENVSTNLLPPSSEYHFFKFSKHTLNKDPTLHKKISTFLCETFPGDLSHSKRKINEMQIIQQAIALDAEIFSHFEHLTQTLLYAFREFIQVFIFKKKQLTRIMKYCVARPQDFNVEPTDQNSKAQSFHSFYVFRES
jgi:hypothetical protein